MNLHLHKNDILRLLCDKYQIACDIIKDENDTEVYIFIKEPGINITWEGVGYEIETKKDKEKSK